MQGVLAGRYRLERQLGKGGMGSVWLAEHLALRSWVAVKLMDPAIAATPEGAERFRREAQAAASLRSTHVVQVLDYGVHENTPFLVMELLYGESLAGCLEREKRLTPQRTLTIMTQVARALSRAHAAGIVHRDLKPDNIFLVKEDDQELVKILDFGIAKTPQAHFGGMETRTGVTMGTPYYMSPEQAEGKRAVDLRTDLWAMAVITSECMTGVRPFDGSTYGELLLNICARPIPPPSSQGLTLPGFDAWFAKATSRDLEQRFASAQELASTLAAVVQGAPQGYAASLPATGPVASPSGAVPAGTGAAPPRPVTGSSLNTAQSLDDALPAGVPRRSSALPWLLLGALVLLGGLGAVLLLSRTPAAPPAAEAASPSPAPLAAARPSAPVELAPPPTSVSERGDERALHNKPTAQAPAAATPARSAASASATASAAPAAAAKAPPSQSVRCFSDPFSGQIRLAGPSKPASAATFACQMDPFTGRYRKL